MSPDPDIQKQLFARDGYATYRDVIDRELVQEARGHVVWLLKNNPGLRPEHLHTHLMRNDPFWVRLVSDHRLLDIAEQYVGSNVALFASHYISKPPDDGQAVLWHQDGSYWPLKPMNVVTLWLAVDDSTPENGCLRVIPGTQDMDLQQMQRHTDVPNVLSSRLDPALVPDHRAVDITLKAGDVSVHHPNIIHGSNTNRSGVRRTGLTIRYIPTTTRIVSDKEWPSAFLLRGEAVPGINDYLPVPSYRDGEHMPFQGCERWQ